MPPILPLLLTPLLLLLPPIHSSSDETPKLKLWPLPTQLSWPIPSISPVSPSFRITSPRPQHPYLRTAARRYARLLRSERHRPLLPPSASSLNFTRDSPLLTLAISVADPSAPLRDGVDESYSLSVSSGLARLAAATPWGAIRGLETLSQLAWAFPGGRQCDPLIVVVPTEINISDRPIFGHRGVMLDTSRNFYPVADILRTIRAMGHNKLNVFHWHITDSQSFPLMLPSEPRLAMEGSYGEAMVYSPEDVRRIVEYAMGYGVRVVPEFDAPGHTGSWAEAYPEIVTCANEFWSPPGGPSFASEPGTGQLNPLNPKTYEVFHNVLRDAALLFPDPFLHAGADEISTACWESDPAVRRFLSAGGTHDALLELFINATHPFISSDLNRTAVYWEDVLLGTSVKAPSASLPRETTVLHTWNNGPSNTKRITAAGYRAIVSSSDFYYLDCGHGGWVGNDSRYDRQEGDAPGKPFNCEGGGSWCAPFKTWQRVYDYDITHGLSEEEARLVLGGEVVLWSEQADETVLDARLWPRAAAMAEALWSGNRDAEGKKRYAAATDRLSEWRYRMVRRGIKAEPIQPLWCVRHPGMCNLVQ